jgi:multidrug efflux pump subunit AcrA (membrane-fusion protein)
MTAPVLAVPTSAVFERDGRKYVYVIDQDHVLLTEVTIGMQNTEFTAVNSGISAGTEVVSSDTVLLMNGDRILRSK